MSEETLRKVLISAGWASLFGFLVKVLCDNLIQIQRAKNAGLDDEAINLTIFAYVFGSLIESPLNVAIGVLCLCAAFYLRQNVKPISETFE